MPLRKLRSGLRDTVGCLSETCFEVQEGGQTRIVPLADGPVTIGRAPTADVVLGAPWVAEAHARLDLIAGAHHVIAVGGAVLLGGAPVTDAVLHDGDIVRLPDPPTRSLDTLV